MSLEINVPLEHLELGDELGNELVEYSIVYSLEPLVGRTNEHVVLLRKNNGKLFDDIDIPVVKSVDKDVLDLIDNYCL